MSGKGLTMRQKMGIASYLLGLIALSPFLVMGAAVQAEPIERIVPQSQAAITQSFAPVVRHASPAVVNVYVKRRVAEAASPFFNDPFFRQFFGENFGVPRERVQNSLGSGVLVAPDGVVVTSHHVIAGRGEAEITIALVDGREFPAEVVVSDEKTDLAVLRVDAENVIFPYLEFHDSDALEVGDLVLAIGNPFGVGQTVTSGIVSALSRTHVGISEQQFFIQTDAAINPGNSGGALVGMNGRLIGINTMIFSRSGGSHGIGFAIPSNMVRVVVQAALQGGAVKRPWLGASLQPITTDIAASLGLERPSGALVRNVNPRGPAAASGLRAGDVIVNLDGQAVSDPGVVNYRLVTKGVGAQVELHFLRDGKTFKTNVELVPPLEDPPRDLRELSGRHALAGVKVANLSPAVAEEFGMDDNRSGVVVMEVERNTAAARLGIRPGDIVAGVNESKVASVSELESILTGGFGLWRLSVERGGRVFNLELRG
jgi:Do/DeqQ family serine protease